MYGEDGGFAWNGRGNFDSQDVVAVQKSGGRTTQGAPVREFGHMLGPRDEYPGKDGTVEDNPNWLTDTRSVMNGDEQVRDRHYAMFADWLTRQHGRMQIQQHASSNFAMNATLPLANAKL